MKTKHRRVHKKLVSEFSEKQIIWTILNLSTSWLPVITEAKLDTYEGLLRALHEVSERFPYINRKQSFAELLLRENVKIDSAIAALNEAKLINIGVLNNLIRKFNNRFKCKPNEITEYILQDERLKKYYGEVFTPFTLIDDILDKLPKELWVNPDLTWLDFSCGSGGFLIKIKERLMEGLRLAIPDAQERERHILEEMIYGVDIQPRNCVLSSMRLDFEGKYKVNITSADSLKFDFWEKKFDVITSNPPYQAPVKKNKGGSGSGSVIWDKFVKLSLTQTADNGCVALVHPALWRRPGSPMWEGMWQHRYLYVEIHNDQDGLKTFGATTRYDWYVLQKNTNGLTEVKFEDGSTDTLDLHSLPFIPNYDIEILKKILAKDGEARAEIMFSYQLHEPRKLWMSSVKNETHCYPCIHATPKTESVQILYSSRKSNFFVPKVIFGEARHIHNVIVDDVGEYGMTHHAMGLPISSKEEGEQIKKALQSDKFNDFLKACRWSNFSIEWRMFQFFRKDFWKEFLP